ncbi:hypothetical protein AYO20_09688 [Fonsecaea nubica]|uniref:Major facilitator superfamily (MFS) profile domain-containing protein n=1 Tax=Fonsecaea nubica TaxID=856822 RepID=A0A178CFL6_9EURO|nr:hypothetical protein AYO20_09688 [Fonsecaea nubica]OAL27835.1 hypothetical protein AYO20_09688 [Fonsecaea nubica]
MGITEQSTIVHDNSKEQQLHEHEEVEGEDGFAAKSWTRRYIAIGALCYVYCVSLGPYMMLAPIITIINQDLGPDPGFAWIASGWTVAAAVGLLLVSTVSDLVGRRWVAVSTTVLAIISAILGITAQTIGQVIAANVMLGLNQAGALTGFAGIAELVPTRARGIAIGFANLTVGVWSICGSLFGHEFATHTGPGWRSIYWLQLATNIVGLVAVFFSYYPAKPLLAAHQSRRNIIRTFDYVGALGIIAGPTLMLVGIINVSQYSPSSGRFLGPFIAGVVVCIALGVWEAYGTKNPLLHPFLFARFRTFSLICIVTFLSGGLFFYGFQALFPQFLVLVFGNDARQTGIDGIPLGAGTWVGGVSSLFLLKPVARRIGTTPILASGAFATALFVPLLALVDGSSKRMVYGFTCFAGFGTGIVDAYTLPLITLTAPDELIGLAIGTVGFMRSIGGAAGISVFSSILSSKAATLIPARVVPAALQAGLPETSLAEFMGVLTGATPGVEITDISGVTTEIVQIASAALRDAYLAAFKYIWYSGIAFSVSAFLMSLFIRDLSAHLTGKTPQHLKQEEIASSSDHLEEVKAVVIENECPKESDPQIS